MKYSFKENRNIINGVELVSASELINAFFHAFNKSQYLKFIEGLTKREGYLGDPKGMMFYDELDGEDFAEGHIFEKDEVEVYFHTIGEEIIKEELFFQIVVDYTRALMKVHRNDSSFIKSMNEVLRKLEA